MDVIIGVDGGGTKTNLVALNAATGAEVARATTGSINVYFGGLDQAAANMRQALDALALGEDDRVIAVGVGDPALDDSCLAEGQALREKIGLAVTGLVEKTSLFSSAEPSVQLSGTMTTAVLLTSPPAILVPV